MSCQSQFRSCGCDGGLTCTLPGLPVYTLVYAIGDCRSAGEAAYVAAPPGANYGWLAQSSPGCSPEVTTDYSGVMNYPISYLCYVSGELGATMCQGYNYANPDITFYGSSATVFGPSDPTCLGWTFYSSAQNCWPEGTVFPGVVPAGSILSQTSTQIPALNSGQSYLIVPPAGNFVFASLTCGWCADEALDP